MSVISRWDWLLDTSRQLPAGLRRGHDSVPEVSQRCFQVAEALLVTHSP
jgi:hypothetical protein